jgi:phosphatidylethanolamine-binding protein (PEBP) family uncharacterized protein
MRYITQCFVIFSVLFLYGGNIMAMQLTSTAFTEGEQIPEKYGCHGSDVSLPLAWSEEPKDTQSFVLIMGDPDAPMGTYPTKLG